MFTVSDAEKLIKLARKAIEYFNLTSTKYSSLAPEAKFQQKAGVFVTLHKYPSHELRGCIGIPKAILPVWNAVIEAATGASRDPRFDPVTNEELEQITIELSILTEPKEINKQKLPNAIEIGKHGIIIEKGYHSGLLLPQVAVEYSWDAETFLQHACLKAMLPKNAWKLRDCKVYTFEAQVFAEEKPKGKVKELRF